MEFIMKQVNVSRGENGEKEGFIGQPRLAGELAILEALPPCPRFSNFPSSSVERLVASAIQEPRYDGWPVPVSSPCHAI